MPSALSGSQWAGSRHQQPGDTIPTSGAASEGPDAREVRVLRAKYFDWCSARVAEQFLSLSPDEIFELAERAGHTDEEARSLSASGLDDLSSYRAIVEQVTGVLAEQLDLPSFDEWLELYRSDPLGVEADLLGFWKEAE